MYQEFDNSYKEKKQDDYTGKDHNDEPEKKESFWKTLSRMFCSLAMFNAINKHY